MTNCTECLKPCPEHGMLRCATCHKHPGECNMGDCQKPSTQLFEFSDQGRVFERRRFCRKHSTDPAFGWLRRDGVPVEG